MTILRLAAAVSLLAWSTHVAAQAPVAGPSSAVRSSRSTSRVPPGARANVLTTIQGNALTSTNGPLAAAVVRLRDARTGKVVDVQTTDEAGLFAFRNVEPGSYVVELMAPDQTTVLTASQMLSVNAGDAASAVVKLPFRIPPFAGIMGSSSTQSIAALAAQAATSGIAAVTPLGEPTCAIQ
ncbi:MAG TPA: carboxypeptidase-like regulatory domain-containing protein [Vicinamibacterales bacterium]|jgi:hypothetical protein